MDLHTALGIGEDTDVEFKFAADHLPRSLWETYSAMANTEGGFIVLGVEESGGGFDLRGVRSPRKLRKQFWDLVNNRQKVSANLLDNAHVVDYVEGGKSLLIIHVPQATRTQRPVHVGPNPLTGTYMRSFEGDYKCDEDTVRRMIADAVHDARDDEVLAGYTMGDVDGSTLQAYRARMRASRPDHPWIELRDQELLSQLGAWRRDRATDDEGLTAAGVLMFGRERSILDSLPKYNVDYREVADDPDSRWVDRLTLDGTWSGNLFDFYRSCFRKLTEGLKIPFRLEGDTRRDETHIHEALREGLVNCLIHAEHGEGAGIVVLRSSGGWVFSNPGRSRVPTEQALRGGLSDCRNPSLQKMFQMVGLGERAGSGLARILRAWQEQHWRTPIFEDDIEENRTRLLLLPVSLVPLEALAELESRFGPTFNAMSDVERLALVAAHLEGQVTNARLQQMTEEHPAEITKVLQGLAARHFLDQAGRKRGAYYRLAGARQPSLLGLFEFERLPASTETSIASTKTSVASTESDLASTENGEHVIEASLPEPATVVRDTRRVRRTEEMDSAILALCTGRWLTLRQLAEVLHRTPRTLKNNYLRRLIREGRLEYRYPETPTHQQQAYRTAEHAEKET